MATKTNSQRVIEARKKREEERKNSSSNTYSNSDRVKKLKYEREIGFDTFDSDLANTNTTLSSVLGGWQTQETLANARTAVESMYKRTSDYQNYISKYKPDEQTNLGEVSEYYKGLLDSWDNIAGTYGQYKDADSYTKETTKLKELQSMTRDELASYLKGDNPIAYTTYGGQDITWKGLYDEKFQKEMANSKEGAEGWKKYLADKEAVPAETKKDKSFLENVAGFMGGITDTSLPAVALQQVVIDKRNDTSYMNPTDEWTDEERNIFGAYYLEDPDSAYEYATNLNNSKNKAKKDEKKQKIADSATSSGLAGTGHTLASIALAPTAIYDFLDDLTDSASGRPILEESFVTPFEYSQEVQGSIGTHLNEKSGTINENIPVLGGKGLGDLYGVGTSIAQSALSGYALGGIGTMVSYFGQGASAGIDEALSRGATDKQAMLYGVLVGAGEGISEKIGVDNMFKLGSADTVKGFIKNVLKQAGSEGIEEGVSSLISEVADRVVMQDKSVYENAVRTYMTQGMTEEEAKAQAGKDTFNSIAWDVVAGAVSGGVHGGIQTTKQSIAENSYNKGVGSAIRENETIDDLKNFASESGSDAYQKYIDLIDSGKIKDAQLGKFFNEVESEAINSYNSERDNARMRTVADMANELGDSKNSGLIASAIMKQKDGQKLSSEEKAVLKTDTAQAILETIGDDEIDVKGSDSLNSAVKRAWQVDSIVTPRTVEEKAVASATKEAKATAQEIQTKVSEKVEAEGREDISFYSESMEQAKAEAFNKIYDGNADLESYANSFELAYTYGKNKIGLSEALRNKGVLTEAQALKAYEAGNVGRAIEKQAKVDAINKQYSSKTFVKGTFNDSIIDYKGNAEGKVSWKELGASRQNALKFLKAFAEVTGVNVEIISSTVNEKGEREGEHGRYEDSTNTIYIDAYAGSMDASILNDAIIPTVSHEVTHWMKAKAPAMYQKMQDYVLDVLAGSDEVTLNGLIANQKAVMKRNYMKRNNGKTREFTDEEAIDELVARGCEDMLANSDKVRKMLAKMSKTEQDSFIAKVKETFENIMNWVNDLLKQYKSNSKEAELLRQYKERMKELSKMWDTTLAEAIQTNQSMKQMEAEGITNEKIYEALNGNGISKDGTTIIGENMTQMSERTYAEGGREFLQNWLNQKVASEEMSEYDAENIIIQTDMLYDLMQEIKAGNDLPDYAKWAQTEATFDENGEQVTVIVQNGDYKMNLDSSQVCKKRTALNAVLNAMVQSNELSAYTLTEKDVATLNDIIKKHEFEIACALCFVDSKRYRIGEWAESFCEGVHTKKDNKYGFNEMVRSLVPEGSDIQIDEYNFTGRKFKNPKKNLLKDAPDSKLDFSLLDKIMEENGDKTAQYKMAKAIKENKELRSILNQSEIISSIGLDSLRVKNMKLYSLVNVHQGTAKPKFAHDSVAYGNDILKTTWASEDAKYVGGVRVQSFSDFMANMVFDYVQMISELSARELTSHAYTKEPLFVKLFGLTGMKINMSLVPRVAITDEQKARFAKLSDKKKKTDAEYLEAKEHAGLYLDKNGKWQYAWEDETFPYDVAMDIMADPRYTKNCGTIAVGISNLHIEKLLADDRISMVIPYHKSGLNHTVAIMRNIDLYNDYTNYQNTRGTDGKKLESGDFNFYEDLYGTDNKQGTHDPKQTAENYKNWCAENGYLPKFDQFKDNPNYYKLLIDFTVYDINDNMKYTEQEAVKPIYPSKEEFKELITKGVVKNGVTYGGLEQSQTTSDKLKAETNTIIKEFKKALTDEYGDDVLKAQYSDRDSEGNQLTEAQQEFFKDSKVRDENGNLLALYHGSNSYGFTVFDTVNDREYGSHFGTKESASRFSEKMYKVYLNITNPITLPDIFGEVYKLADYVYLLHGHKEKMQGSLTNGVTRKLLTPINTRTELPMNSAFKRYAQSAEEWVWDDGSEEGAIEVAKLAQEYLKSLGYDGVVYTNQFEDEGSTSYMVLDSNQIKNTDNTNPTSDADIRYSDRDIDSWLDALDIEDLIEDLQDMFWGDGETTSTETPKKQRAKRRVDEVKKRLDAIGLSFTGTKSLAFTDERIEQYLREFGASTPNYAQAYIAYMTPQQFLNLTVGGKTTTVDMIENESASYGEIDFEKLGRSGAMFLDIHEKDGKAKVTGHEGRHRMLLLGKAGFERIPVLLFDYRTKYNKTAKDSLKLTTQRYNDEDFISKTRDTVIHDLVPLSTGNRDLVIQKFGSGVEADVHYSDRDYTSVYELMGEKDTLDEENRKLKADIEKLKATIGSEDVKITRFRSLADYLKKHAGSNYSREALGDALKNLYNYIQTTDDLKWYNVMAKAEEIANDMMQLNVPINYFREVMTDIRQDKVSLSEEQYAEAVKLYGSYGNLHKALFGSINLTKSGKPLEEQWKDWSKAFPTVFKADISAVDMVKELRDIVDALKSTSAVMGEYERQEAIRHMGMEIYNQFWNIASDSSEAVRKERVAHREMMEEMRKNYEKRQAEKTLHPVGEVALKYEKLLKDTIKRDRAQMKRIRELGNKRMEEYKERAEKRATIQKITKNALTLNEWFVKNSKDKHIPEDMKGAVVQLISAIDFSSKQMLGIGGAEERRGQPTGNDLRLAKALSRLYEVSDEMKDNQTEDSVFMELDIPDSAVTLLKQLSTKSLVLNKMNLEQLQALDVIVSTFKSAIIKANKNFVLAQNETRERTSNTLIHDVDSLKDKKADNLATNFLEYANTTPYYMLKRLGRVGEQIFNVLMDAQEKLVFLEEEITNFVKKTVDGKKIKQWSEEIHEIKILDGKRSTENNPKYKTIKMTTAQIMSLYALEKRESAKLHLAGGGIRIANIKDGLKTIKDAEGSSLAKSELHSIIGRLTNEQKRVADALQKYMSETGAEWGNKVTMARWDIKQFGEENYFPMATIAVDKNLDDVGKKDNSIYRLLNMSFTKELTPKANNQLIIDNIFDVFAEHMTDMAKYTTHALPLLDTMKILGYSRKDFYVDEDGKKSVRHDTISVASSIRRAFGDNGYRYIINLLKDLNGVEVTPRDEALTKTLMANYKISAVGGNLRVALLQGSAYIKAGLVMNPKYLTKALATNGLEGIKKAMKHSGIALWKSKGHYDLNIGRSVASEIKQDENWMDTVREWSLKGAEWGDKITWGYLWNACELWAKENTPYSYNSAEFNKAVADKLREIIVKTQVVDSTLTRSQMMRGKSAMVQTLTAFMSESTMTYNMVSDAFFEWSLDARKEGHSYKSTFSKHGRKFATTAGVYALTAFATALAGGFVDAVRDDDEDEEFDEKYLQHLLEALGDNLNLFANLPIAKDIVSIAQGYSPSRFDEQSFVNLFSGMRQWMKVAEGEGNVYKATYKTLQGLSQLSGLPVSNAMRDVVAMWNSTIGEMYPHLKIEQ